MFEKILPFTRKRHVAGLKCAFTGHRPQNLPFRFDETDERCLRLKAELRNLIVQMIEQKNVTHFISGMALGIDTYAAEMVLDLKTDFPFITLECALPCETQAAKWSERYRNRYFKIVEQCDTGQIQITKTSADYNSMNGWPAGTPIPNTVFEIYNYRTGKLVDTIKTDRNGVAVSKPLPLGRYKIVEAQAAEFYGLDKTPIEVELEFAGQIVKAFNVRGVGFRV